MTSKTLTVGLAAITCVLGACTTATNTGSQALHNARSEGGRGYSMEVTTVSQPQEPAYGWHYYSDPPAEHAVVISPAGEYFLSLGRGMQQVTGPDASALSSR